MKDLDQLILENKYISILEEAPKQRGFVQSAWDKTGGAFLQHPTSMARNELIDIYKKVWDHMENEFEKLKTINKNQKEEYNLEFIANFLQKNYPQIDLNNTIQPLADEYDPQGNYLDPIDEQTAGDFLYDCLQNHYTSIGGLPSSKNPQNLPPISPQQTPQQQPPQQQPPQQQPPQQQPPQQQPPQQQPPQQPQQKRGLTPPNKKNRSIDRNKKDSKDGYFKNLKNLIMTGEVPSKFKSKSGIRHT